MSPSRYFTNLLILHSYYTEIELEGINGATSYVEPTLVDIPKISVEFLDTDQGTRMELETVLNQTDQGLRVYASYWWDPFFLKTRSDIYDVSLLGINVLTMLVCAIIFICQQRRLVRIQAMIVVLQTRRVPQAAGLELSRLLSMTPPTEAPGKTHSEMIVEFGNTYWLILFGLFVVVTGLYKAWHLGCRWWSKEVSNQVACSSLVLDIFDGDYGLYIRLVDLDGIHSQLVITSNGIIENLVLVGCLIPVVTYTWTVSVQNNIAGVITCPGRTAM